MYSNLHYIDYLIHLTCNLYANNFNIKRCKRKPIHINLQYIMPSSQKPFTFITSSYPAATKAYCASISKHMQVTFS